MSIYFIYVIYKKIVALILKNVNKYFGQTIIRFKTVYFVN